MEACKAARRFQVVARFKQIDQLPWAFEFIEFRSEFIEYP